MTAASALTTNGLTITSPLRSSPNVEAIGAR